MMFVCCGARDEHVNRTLEWTSDNKDTVVTKKVSPFDPKLEADQVLVRVDYVLVSHTDDLKAFRPRYFSGNVSKLGTSPNNKDIRKGDDVFGYVTGQSAAQDWLIVPSGQIAKSPVSDAAFAAALPINVQWAEAIATTVKKEDKVYIQGETNQIQMVKNVISGLGSPIVKKEEIKDSKVILNFTKTDFEKAEHEFLGFTWKETQGKFKQVPHKKEHEAAEWTKLVESIKKNTNWWKGVKATAVKDKTELLNSLKETAESKQPYTIIDVSGFKNLEKKEEPKKEEPKKVEEPKKEVAGTTPGQKTN